MRPDARELGQRLDSLCELSDQELQLEKTEAYALGYEKYSMQTVKPERDALLNE